MLEFQVPENLEFYEKLPLLQEKAAVCEKLSEFSRRIGGLLGLPEVQSHSPWQACLDDLLGAVYGLFYATRYNYADRTHALGAEYLQLVLTRAKDMSSLKVRTEGLWTAGFYFNSALFRIAAVYDRALKVATGKDDKFEKLLKETEKRFKDSQKRDWVTTNLRKVHCEVNQLKHARGSIYDGRNVGSMKLSRL
jgi:hypothetical protein